MAQKGTTAGTAAKFQNASKSGVRHGPSDKNHSTGAAPRGKLGKGASASTTAPLKGPDRGGLS